MNPKLVYPRPSDKNTVYLRSVVTDASITVGDYTMYNDFRDDPRDFQKNNVLYHYPVNGDKLFIGKYCSVACGAKFMSKFNGGVSRPFLFVLTAAVLIGVAARMHSCDVPAFGISLPNGYSARSYDDYFISSRIYDAAGELVLKEVSEFGFCDSLVYGQTNAGRYFIIDTHGGKLAYPLNESEYIFDCTGI